MDRLEEVRVGKKAVVEDLLGRLGLPKQRRARKTRQTVLEAARECFNEHGFDRTPIKDIAAAAGVSVGTIYEHFKDKRTLLKAVGQMELRRLKSEAFGPFQDAIVSADRDGTELPDLEEIIRLAIRGTLESFRSYPRLLAELVDIAYRDQEFFAFVQEISDEAARFVQGLLVFFGARPAGPQSKRTARLLVLVCEGAVRKFTLYGDALSEEELVEEMTALITSYLFPGKLSEKAQQTS